MLLQWDCVRANALGAVGGVGGGVPGGVCGLGGVGGGLPGGVPGQVESNWKSPRRPECGKVLES